MTESKIPGIQPMNTARKMRGTVFILTLLVLSLSTLTSTGKARNFTAEGTKISVTQ